MSAMFERLAERFFGKPAATFGKPAATFGKPAATFARTLCTTIQQQQQSKKIKKQVRIHEEKNEIYILPSPSPSPPKVKRSIERNLRSIDQKPFVPPVGTVLQALSKNKNLLCAVVVLPDHRLLEVQRGSMIGIHLHPRFIFNTPYDWQCWLNTM